MTSSAEQLLAIIDREVKKVPIRGGELYVRSLTVSEHLAMEAANATASGDRFKLMVNQIAAYVCAEDGSALFTPEQAALFAEKRHPETIKKVVEAAMSLNGYGKEAREEIAGNS